MNKPTIKILVVVDTEIDYLPDIETALEKQRRDYVTATDNELEVEWQIIRQDLFDLQWIEYGYGQNNYGVSTRWLYADQKEKESDPALWGFYSIAYVIDESNWTTQGNQGIWGWSIGPAEQTLIQLIKGMKGRVTAMYWTFLMELMHSWDDTYFKVTRKRLESVFMVQDYDEDIVHGRLPEYTSFQYLPVLRKMKDILLDIFVNTMLRLVKTEARPETYAVVGDEKYWIVPEGMLHKGHTILWDETRIETISDQELASLKEGGVFGKFSA